MMYQMLHTKRRFGLNDAESGQTCKELFESTDRVGMAGGTDDGISGHVQNSASALKAALIPAYRSVLKGRDHLQGLQESADIATCKDSGVVA